jgi:hypothetical protein
VNKKWEMKMKLFKIFFLFLLLSFLQTCDTVESDKGYIQIKAGDDSLIPDSVKTEMREDAARLTLNDVYSNPTQKENLIILPGDIVESYYRGFVHIYNAENLPARDSVVEKYKIHTIHVPQTHFLIVAFDSTKEWAQEWKNGHRLTGNQQIDFLMETYGLELSEYYSFPWHHAVKLFSVKPLNIYALSKKFEPIEGVIYAEPMGVCCDGSDIKGGIEDYIRYEFSYKWGDCPAGCLYSHYWFFHVKFDGTVEFIGSYGDPLP